METQTKPQEPASSPATDKNETKPNDAASETRTGGDISHTADDATRSPEEEAQSQIPGDPRQVNQLQPPTKEQY